MSANYFPAARNITSSYDVGMLQETGRIFALSNYDKRKLALRKYLLVDVINEFASSKENEDMKEEVAARSKPRKKKKKKKKKTSARKTRATNGKKVAMREKKRKKHWRELKANTTEKKWTSYPRLLRARGKIQLAVAGSDRRRMYALSYAMLCPLVSLGRHRYKCISCTSAFPFNSVSLPWLDDDPSTKGHSSLVVFILFLLVVLLFLGETCR